jgi:hypothetical protein
MHGIKLAVVCEGLSDLRRSQTGRVEDNSLDLRAYVVNDRVEI